MSNRKVPLLTVKSLTALSKVCSSTNSSISIKTLTTAAQRSDFSNSADYNFDNSGGPFQNPSSSYSETRNHNGNGLNPNWNFRETTGNVVDNNQVSPIGNPGSSYHQYSGNHHHVSESVDRNFGGHGVGSNGQLQYSQREVFTQNSSSWRGLNSGDGNYQGRLESQGSWTGNYTRDTNQFQPGSSGYNAGNVGMYQHNSNVGYGQQNVNVPQYQQNWNGVNNVIGASKLSNNPEVERNSGEASEGTSSKGTLEEFDELCEEKKVKEAVAILPLLEEQRIPVDLPRLLQLMQACGEAKALEEAKAIHNYIVRSQPPLEVSMYNNILEMYGKCGDMDSASAVFNKMPEHNFASWDTMITWLAKNGLGEDAIDLFSQFKRAGLVPEAQLYTRVFSACGVVGDVTEGMLHFESMKKDYGIIPSMEHFVGIVNMMGTCGYLDEALKFIETMPIEPSIDVWETLMNLSRVHGNLELGDRCAELVEILDPSRLNKQSKAGLVPVDESELMKEKEKKLGSRNLLEVRSRVHEYRAGDTSHPETDRIYTMLRGLRTQMKEDGYIPETRFVLHDVDQECKEDALLSHSERLAAAYGFFTSPARSPIRVIKNLRVCGDCHNALKIISKIVGRELIMRDAKRFHHFKNGVCSCRDYW
ncbi:pentatricopeptide repeat-containing protein At4g32450, mitochondrial [Mercurialis annua]|uniref:pentatricopeptide repeat-containing protein At4g32450, mitochondrial n=1 Tax=Mercurialis annua TaxID=3986 RepID=UPI00215F2A73|nr:pentatricopeptide repeat-containing protein At4g32450, mitochondrial [Mercurialis annua]